MKDAYSVVKTLIRTEKGTTLQTLNKYLFCVANDANKIEIKKAIEEIFKVRVASV
ncbi:MAG: 50S ribosomal protein L23, partial [Candidatus Omnitrophica bacterium]|nr:50S ribosomal protein L23 [Candidatus Omnitrophota bacterium]